MTDAHTARGLCAACSSGCGPHCVCACHGPKAEPSSSARTPDQRSLYEQVSDLWRFAREQKMYDAQDWIATHWQGRPLPWSLSVEPPDDTLLDEVNQW